MLLYPTARCKTVEANKLQLFMLIGLTSPCHFQFFSKWRLKRAGEKAVILS